MRYAIAGAFGLPVASLVWTLGIVFFLAFARRWVRFEWLAAVIADHSLLVHLCRIDVFNPWGRKLYIAMLVFVSIRFGLLAAFTLDILSNALHAFVRTADASAWYFYTGPIAISVVLAVAASGYRTATAGGAVAAAEA